MDETDNKTKNLDHVLGDRVTKDNRLFFYTRDDRDAEKIRAFLAGAPDKTTRVILQAMIRASMLGVRCELGRKILTYPNKWHNAVYLEVKE